MVAKKQTKIVQKSKTSAVVQVAAKTQNNSKAAKAPISQEEESADDSEVEGDDDEDEEESEDDEEQEEGADEELDVDDEDEDEDEEDDDNEEEDGDEDEDDEDEDKEEMDEESKDIDISREDVVDDLSYDVYNLTACNYHPVILPHASKLEETLAEGASRAAELLFKRLVDLPQEKSEIGMLSLLPAEVFLLPRSHRLPEPKPETKWEKFAKEKGITKKKRDRMIYDEEHEDFRPRFGYKRANNGVDDMAIVEVKKNDDPFKDPWAEASTTKKDNVKRNTKNMLKNQTRADKIMKKKHPTRAVKYDSASIPGIPLDIDNGLGKRGKQGVRQTLQLVQHSTASMGRFDEKKKGEPERKLKGKKRSFRDNMVPDATDKASMKANMRIVTDKIDKKARGVTNSLSAYEGIIPDAPSDGFKKKKGKGKDRAGAEGKKSAGTGSKKAPPKGKNSLVKKKK